MSVTLRLAAVGSTVLLGALLAACAKPTGTTSAGTSTGASGFGAPKPSTTSTANAFATERTRPVAPAAKRLKVALLAPVSKAGAPATEGEAGTQDSLGVALERAAKLAMRDRGEPFELIVIDTGGTVAGSQEGARQAVKRGAHLVIGPVFAANVAAASAVTLPAGVPMLSLSSDTNRAGNGVYAKSFTPQADVAAILDHAVKLGTRHVVVFAPEGRYGDIVLKAARETLDRAGGQVAFVVRTDGTAEGYLAAGRKAALAAEGADALYIPEGGRAPRAIVGALARAGVDLSGKRILGSGQWRSAATKKSLADKRLNGALFASPDPAAFKTFAYRYESMHARKPSPVAALAYDATAVAIQLARQAPGRPYARSSIETVAGFKGATGLFRFRSNGRIQRQLAIFEVRGGVAEVAKVAPPRFEAPNTVRVPVAGVARPAPKKDGFFGRLARR